MELEALLKKALEAVNGAGVPEELREIAFSKAVDILSRTSTPPSGAATPVTPVTPGATAADASANAGTGEGSAPTTGLGKVAQFFSVPPDLIEDLFTEQDGRVRLTLDPDRLGRSTADKAKAAALLYAAAGQVGEYDSDTTHISEVRQECDRLGIYDTANFSKHMNAMSKWFVVNGEKTSRTFRLKPSGRMQAKETVNKLMANDG